MKIKFKNFLDIITEETIKTLIEQMSCRQGYVYDPSKNDCIPLASTGRPKAAPAAAADAPQAQQPAASINAEQKFEALKVKLRPMAKAARTKAPKCNKAGYLGYGAEKSSPEHERQVRVLQQKLIDLEYLPPSMPPDGLFGGGTLVALLAFQLNKLGIGGADGCVGPNTEKALGLDVLKTLKRPARKKYGKSRSARSASRTEWAKETYESAKNILGDRYGETMPQLVVTFGAIESGWGRKSIGNNMFGIKAPMSACKKGKGKYVGTTEVVKGVRTSRKSCFADFASKEDAIEKFSKFLQSSRYVDGSKLFPDAPAFAVAWIWVNGYATAERYVPAQVNMAKSVARRTGIADFNWEFPEELKNAVKLLANTNAMAEYALEDSDIEAQKGGTSKRRSLKRYLRKSKDPNISQKKRDNYSMHLAGAGKRYLGKKLVAKAYATWKGKDPVEAQKQAEEAARVGYGALKLPMPSREQLVAKAEELKATEEKYGLA